MKKYFFGIVLSALSISGLYAVSAEEQFNTDMFALCLPEIMKAQTFIEQLPHYLSPEKRQEMRHIALQFIDEYEKLAVIDDVLWRSVTNCSYELVDACEQLVQDKNIYSSKTVRDVIENSAWKIFYQKLEQVREALRLLYAPYAYELPLMAACAREIDAYMCHMIQRIYAILEVHADALAIDLSHEDFAQDMARVSASCAQVRGNVERWKETRLLMQPYLQEVMNALREVIMDDASGDVLYTFLMRYHTTGTAEMIEMTPALQRMSEVGVRFLQAYESITGYSVVKLWGMDRELCI